MKRLLVSLLAVSFIIWILPLGVFIKPSQQALACDGQRAICMCHVMLPKPDKAMEAGMALKAASSTNKENSSGSAGNYFVSARSAVTVNLQSASLFESQYLSYKNPFLSPLDSVPKI